MLDVGPKLSRVIGDGHRGERCPADQEQQHADHRSARGWWDRVGGRRCGESCPASGERADRDRDPQRHGSRRLVGHDDDDRPGGRQSEPRTAKSAHDAGPALRAVSGCGHCAHEVGAVTSGPQNEMTPVQAPPRPPRTGSTSTFAPTITPPRSSGWLRSAPPGSPSDRAGSMTAETPGERQAKRRLAAHASRAVAHSSPSALWITSVVEAPGTELFARVAHGGYLGMGCRVGRQRVRSPTRLPPVQDA